MDVNQRNTEAYDGHQHQVIEALKSQQHCKTVQHFSISKHIYIVIKWIKNNNQNQDYYKHQWSITRWKRKISMDLSNPITKKGSFTCSFSCYGSKVGDIPHMKLTDLSCLSQIHNPSPWRKKKWHGCLKLFGCVWKGLINKSVSAFVNWLLVRINPTSVLLDSIFPSFAEHLHFNEGLSSYLQACYNLNQQNGCIYTYITIRENRIH